MGVYVYGFGRPQLGRMDARAGGHFAIAVQRFEPVLKKRRFGGSGSSRLTWRTWALKLWYQILVPASWYQDLGTKILVPKKTESPRGGASRYAGGYGGLQAPRQGVWGAGRPPGTAKNCFSTPEGLFPLQQRCFHSKIQL